MEFMHMMTDALTIDDLPPFLEDFRELSHIASELNRPIYEGLFAESHVRTEMIKHAHQLSHIALQFLQQQNGSLENERIRVAVIGDFSSGKSSFINSLLGQEICPVNVAPSTSSITTFKYGDHESIFQIGDSEKLEKRQQREISREEYEQLVTHQGKEKKKSDATRLEFEIHYPFDGFRDIELYDTPGFNNAENNQDELITLRKCRSADVILFVFDINKGDLPADILQKVLRPLRREKPEQPMIAIVNKADTKPPGKVAEICNGIRGNNVFNQVLDYSAHEEIDAWKKIAVPALPEPILEALKKTNPCKIEVVDKGFMLTPLKPISVKKTPILKWMEEIRGQKAKLIEAKRQSNLRVYNNQVKDLLNNLSNLLKKPQRRYEKINEQNDALSMQAELLKQKPSNLERFIKESLNAAFAEALKLEETESGRFFSNDFCIDFYPDVFKKKLINTYNPDQILYPNLSESIRFLINRNASIDQLYRDLQKLIKNPSEFMFSYACPSFSMEMIYGSQKEATQARWQKIAIVVNDSWSAYQTKIDELIARIAKQLDLDTAKQTGILVTHGEAIDTFAARVSYFSHSFESRNYINLLGD
jgi:GTPase SAR1 family protein